MSRRSRRRRGAGGGGAGWLGKAAIALIALGLLGSALLYAAVRTYLHSDGFRRLLADKASELSGVRGEFTPFRWDGLAVDTAAFEGSGDGLVRGIRLEGIHTEIAVGGLRRGVWELNGTRAQRIDLKLDARKPRHGTGTNAGLDAARPNAFKPAKKKTPGWLPQTVAVQGGEVAEVILRAELDAGTAHASGLRVIAQPAGTRNTHRIEIAGGSIHLPFALIPEIRLKRARLRYQDGRVFLNSAEASAWPDGRLEASGEWDWPSREFAAFGTVSGVTGQDLFNETWAKRLSGDLSSNFTIDNRSGEIVADGRLVLRNGTLTALPVLDALAAYADTRRFRVLALSDSQTKWRWKKDELRLSELVLATEGLIRLEGSMVIRGNQLDGTFRLGLAPGTLATIPGAETHVFMPGERGLLWTPLRITGTLDDPKEDLTDRLIDAAGLRMFDVIPETGERVIKFTRSLIGDSPVESVDKVLDQGGRIIDTGGAIVEGVGGVIGGILGAPTRPPVITPPPEEPTPPTDDR
jgi:hypothetical protein